MRHTSNIIDHIEQAKESQDDKSRQIQDFGIRGFVEEILGG